MQRSPLFFFYVRNVFVCSLNNNFNNKIFCIEIFVSIIAHKSNLKEKKSATGSLYEEWSMPKEQNLTFFTLKIQMSGRPFRGIRDKPIISI